MAVFVRLFPVSKLIDDLRIRLLLDPSLEVSHDILIIQTAQVRDLPQDPLVLLGSVGEFDFLDGVDVTVETMTSLVNYAKTAATEFLQLFKVVSVPWSSMHVVKDVIIDKVASVFTFLIMILNGFDLWLLGTTGSCLSIRLVIGLFVLGFILAVWRTVLRVVLLPNGKTLTPSLFLLELYMSLFLKLTNLSQSLDSLLFNLSFHVALFLLIFNCDL